jgi:hypothetical protein
MREQCTAQEADAQPTPQETADRLRDALESIGVHLAECHLTHGPYEIRAKAPVPDTQALTAWVEEHIPGRTLPALAYSLGPGHEAGSALSRALRGRDMRVWATGIRLNGEELVSILIGAPVARELAALIEEQR